MKSEIEYEMQMSFMELKSIESAFVVVVDDDSNNKSL